MPPQTLTATIKLDRRTGTILPLRPIPSVKYDSILPWESSSSPNLAMEKTALTLPSPPLVRTLRERADSLVTKVAWSPDGSTLAVPTQNGTVELWDVESGHLRQSGDRRDWHHFMAPSTPPSSHPQTD